MLDDELIEDFCSILSAGNFRLTACQRLGIPYSTLRSWMQCGRAEIKRFEEDPTREPTIQAHFVLAVEACEAIMQQSLVQDVANADTKAKMWFLTHRWNKLFNRNTNTVIDDDAAEERKIDPLLVLAERLQDLKGKIEE